VANTADNPEKSYVEVDAIATVSCHGSRNLTINQPETVEFAHLAVA
jgi:hypothetical protein